MIQPERLMPCLLIAAAAMAQAGAAQQPLPRSDLHRAERASQQQDQEPVAEREVLGRPTGFARKADKTHVLEAGDVLLMGPSTTADTVVKIPEGRAADRVAELVERRSTETGEWLRLRWGGRLGWLHWRPEDLSEEGALAVLAAPDRLERRAEIGKLAKQAIPEATEHEWEMSLTVGAGRSVATERRKIRVWSTLPRKPLQRLQRLTACVGELYAARFGAMTAPPPLDLEMVVFPDRDSYDRFVATTTTVAASETTGFELDGLIVIAANEGMEIGFLGTAAHELTHALNRLAFSAESLRPWVEEGMAEDIAHSVEEAVAQSRKLCRRPGGWSRTLVEQIAVMSEEGQARKDMNLTRSARARSLLCYPGADRVADLLEVNRTEFAIADDRRWKYVEALLLVRHLLQQGPDDPIKRRQILLEAVVEDPEVVVVQSLADLRWRVTERELMDC